MLTGRWVRGNRGAPAGGAQRKAAARSVGRRGENIMGPGRGEVSGFERNKPRTEGPYNLVPHLDRALVRMTPSLAIGGSAHSQSITSRAGNTSYSSVSLAGVAP